MDNAILSPPSTVSAEADNIQDINTPVTISVDDAVREDTPAPEEETDIVPSPHVSTQWLEQCYRGAKHLTSYYNVD